MQNEVYPFWKLRTHDELIVRFIPDLNEDNENGFIDNYFFHRVEIDGKQNAALCSLVHEKNKPCYYCAAGQRAFKHNDRINRQHWRKRQYIGNVIIINDPIGITDPENPKTYKFPLGKILFDDLRGGMLSEKVKELPSDYYNGNNFGIVRTLNGPYPVYTGTFKNSSRLTDEQITLAKESLIDLTEFRPTLYSSTCQDELSKDLCWDILNRD